MPAMPAVWGLWRGLFCFSLKRFLQKRMKVNRDLSTSISRSNALNTLSDWAGSPLWDTPGASRCALAGSCGWKGGIPMWGVGLHQSPQCFTQYMSLLIAFSWKYDRIAHAYIMSRQFHEFSQNDHACARRAWANIHSKTLSSPSVSFHPSLLELMSWPDSSNI